MHLLSAAQIDSTYKQAIRELTEKRVEDALSKFRTVLQANPDHAGASYQIGRILIAGYRAQNAISMFRRAAELQPNEIGFWQAWAEAVALGGDGGDIPEFENRLKTAPIPVAAKLPLQERFGANYRDSRPVTGGVRPQDIRGLLALMTAQDFPQAHRRAAAIFKAHPKSAFVANILGAAQSARGDQVAAGASFLTAIQLDPKFAEAYENVGRILKEQGKTAQAVGQLRKAIILSPGRVSALVLLGKALTELNKPQSAIPILLRATAEDPDSSEALCALGSAYDWMNALDDAEEAYRKAVEAMGSDVTAEVLAAFANVQSRLGRDDEALGNFDRALVIAPQLPAAISGKATVLQTLARFDEAHVLFRRAIELDPHNGENYRQLCASHKVKAGDPILSEMLELHGNRNLSDHGRMNLAFAIAKAHEDIEEHDRVFDYLDEANTLMRKAYPYSIAKRRRHIKAFKEAMQDFDFRGASIDGATDFAPIFVTGMPRSGTTLVEQIISSHSMVDGAGELGKATAGSNELLFPQGKLRFLGNAPHNEIADFGHTYRKYLLERFPDASRITDKSIATYMTIGVIKLAMPNAKFVVVRRDPRDNLLSIYKNKFPAGTHPYAYDKRDLARYYSTFVDMIEFWRARVPGWFHEVQYEALVSDPEAETRKLISACGLNWEDACLKFHKNKRKVQTLSVFQVRQPISNASVQAWKRYETGLAPMLEVLRKDGHIAD